jgi:hypothetical protein
MHKTRLKRAADLLQRHGPYRGKRPIPPEKFDMAKWCGTAACGAGHCAKDKWFREQGLCIKDFNPFYNGLLGFHALRDFFRLDYSDVMYLFGNTLPSPGQVGARIREFIK